MTAQNRFHLHAPLAGRLQRIVAVFAALTCPVALLAEPAAVGIHRPAAEVASAVVALEPIPPAQSPALVQTVHDAATDLVMSAMSFIGVPYRRGAASAAVGFDCSSFTRHIFETSLGLVLPRSAHAQAAADGFMKVQRPDLKPGDLVFFNTMRRTFSHVGIYLGDHKFIHAPRSGALVRIEDLRQSYWARRFTGARRADSVAEASITH